MWRLDGKGDSDGARGKCICGEAGRCSKALFLSVLLWKIGLRWETGSLPERERTSTPTLAARAAQTSVSCAGAPEGVSRQGVTGTGSVLLLGRTPHLPLFLSLPPGYPAASRFHVVGLTPDSRQHIWET